MNWLKRNAKTIIGTLIILILIECALAYYLAQQFRENYLSSSEAVAIALADAGLEQEETTDLTVKLAHKGGQAWYEVVFVFDGVESAYRIDAESGEILFP